MSYDIALYRIETKEKEILAADENFFEDESNLVPFTAEQRQELQDRLLKYDYEIVREDAFGIHFQHEDEVFGTALLSKAALYFTASWDEDSIFEIGMTASEFTDTGAYAKYDFQQDGWEEI